MNQFLQDALRNASNPTDLRTPWNKAETLHGPYLLDCHFLPQVDFLFNRNRTSRTTQTVLTLESAEADLFALLSRHSHNETMNARSKLKPTALPIQRRELQTKKKRRCGDFCLLSEETLDMLDRYYAEDFELLGFPKNHNLEDLNTAFA
jgi:hypothetical protein